MARFKDFEPRGVIPAAILPFDDEYNVDPVNYKRHLRWLANVEGITGITMNAHSTEVHACPADEQVKILDITADEIGDEVPIVCGVYADGSAEAAKLAKAAEAGGASALLVFPPHSIFFLGGQRRPEMTMAHYREVAAATDLPIIGFHYADHYAFTKDTLLQLCDEIPTFKAIKDWSPPIRHEWNVRTLQNLPRPVNVLTTNSAWMMSSLTMGANGLLSGSGSVIADLHVALFNAIQAKDLAAAQAVNDQIYHTAQLYYSDPAADMHNRMKETLVQLGRIDSATVRPPLMKLSDEEINAVSRMIENAGLTREGGLAQAA